MWKIVSDIKDIFAPLSRENNESEDPDEEGIINGLCFTVQSAIVKKVKCNIPVELLCNILKYVDEDSLVFKCRLVCRQWREVIENIVMDEKANATKTLLGHGSPKQIPWWLSYSMLKKGVFKNNLMKNNCGQNEFKHWDIIANGGDHWIIEKDAVGTVHPLPICDEIGNFRSCFTTSFGWCSKQQEIKLSKVGLSDKIMDEIQPDFECGDWVATRFDCGGTYGLYVILLDKKHKPLVKTEINRDLIAHGMQYNENYYHNPQLNVEAGVGELILQQRYESGEGWLKISGFIKSPYPKGARYIMFYHKGIDTQFWKGHYGIKITGSFIRPIFPKENFLSDVSTPSSEEESLSKLDFME